MVVEVLHSSPSQVQENLNRAKQRRKHTNTRNQNKQDNIDLVNVDYVAPRAKLSQSCAMVYIFGDNEAVIILIMQGRSPNNETRFQNPQICA